ncbi:DUF3592 domain-containing protein [Kribbella sp. NPDC051620]|uniref:DUF3592 domain-containing protein n=1 Tax=Kribbella sp. NPDC051620 TaxID=3364120 RepID=UPI0037AEDC53
MASAARPKKRDRRIWEGICCLLGAVVMLLIAAAMAEDTYWLSRRGEVVTATVLGEKSDHGRAANKRLMVRYTTKSGQQVENDTTNYYDDDLGPTIDVIYDREMPERMQAADWGVDYVSPSVLGGIALIVLTAGAFLLIGSRPD